MPPLGAVISKATFRAGSQFYDVEPSHVAPETGWPRITASNGTAPYAITDNGAGGTFVVVSAGVWDYKPANESKAVSIRVTDNVAAHVDLALAVKASFPIQPQVGYDIEPKTYTKAIFAKDNTPRFRRPPKKSYSWSLQFDNRTIMDVSVVEAFFNFHDIDIEFYYVDIEIEQSVLVRFDSEPKIKVVGPNQFQMVTIVKAHSTSSISIPTVYSGV